MAEETQYTAKTGIVTISTANTNLDGTGTLGTVLTAGANGTLIKTVTFQGLGTTTHGMLRLFITGGGNTRLLMEVEVPAVIRAGTDPAFAVTVPLNFCLQDTYVLKASTEKAESFNVIAEGLDWAYYATSVRQDTTKYTTATNFNLIPATANTNLDGTGTITDILYTETVANGFNGCSIQSIVLKGKGPRSEGMLRIFIGDSITAPINYKLFKEVHVPATAQTATWPAFEHTVEFDNDFELKAGYCLAVSTEIAETFTGTAEGKDWKYQA